MALVSMRELLDHAAANGYGIPAFNVNNLEQVQAVMAAADETGAPVILQASAGARKYAGESFIKHLIRCLMKDSPAYLRAPALACRITGAPVSSAAAITACTCSRLLTLKAGMP